MGNDVAIRIPEVWGGDTLKRPCLEGHGFGWIMCWCKSPINYCVVCVAYNQNFLWTVITTQSSEAIKHDSPGAIWIRAGNRGRPEFEIPVSKSMKRIWNYRFQPARLKIVLRLSGKPYRVKFFLVFGSCHLVAHQKNTLYEHIHANTLSDRLFDEESGKNFNCQQSPQVV